MRVRLAWGMAFTLLVLAPGTAWGAGVPGSEERITITDRDFQALEQPGGRDRSQYVITGDTPEIRQARTEEELERKATQEAFDRSIGVSKSDPEWLKQLKRRTAREMEAIVARYERLLAQMQANYQTMMYRQEQLLASLEGRYRELANRTQVLNPPATQIESVIITPYTGNVILRRRR